jgi:hypothetical protein
MPPSSPAGRNPKRLAYELVIIPQPPWLCAAEDTLSLALVTLVGRNRSEVSPDQVREQLVDVYKHPG